MKATANQISSTLLLLIALGLTVGSGWVHGHWHRRWDASPVVQEASAKLATLPTSFGDWQLHETTELSDNERAILQNYAYFGGTYVHRHTQARVRCFVLFGPPGPTSVHTPEVCFGSQAYCQDGVRAELTIANREDRFWSVCFRATDVNQHAVRAVYAWRFDAAWQNPEQPRFSFGTRPYLYKLQFVCDGDAEATLKTSQDFLREVLPMLDSQLL
ncbi:MAG TPA: exosortase-associated EpsI family protein [Pirellulaceae bacterium]|nr:exosortase-associated EpsI family protein [Pirellulaceae bacterium]